MASQTTAVDPLTGDAQRINAASEALVSAVTRSAFQNAVTKGNAYDAETNDKEITVDTDVGVIWIKNTSNDTNLFIDTLFVTIGSSTGGSTTQDFVTISVLANPSETNSTLVTGGESLTPKNRFVGSGNQATTTVKGNTGSNLTLTGGTELFRIEMSGNSGNAFTTAFAVDIVLGSNQGLGFLYGGLASNTSQTVDLGLKFHFESNNPFLGTSG